MTTAYFRRRVGQSVTVMNDVYAPQQDSQLLIEIMAASTLVTGRKVVDLCTGTGVVAVHAAAYGAASVTAFDICPKAVRCARVNALANGVTVDVHLGSWTRAAEFGLFDLIVCNPPYVPHNPEDKDVLPRSVGPAQAWDAGGDGRLVLDPLCANVAELLAEGGSLLLVQSEFAEPRQTLASLTAAGLHVDIVGRQRIPFGPVMTSRARWLEKAGRLESGRREEELVVIRADKA